MSIKAGLVIGRSGESSSGSMRLFGSVPFRILILALGLGLLVLSLSGASLPTRVGTLRELFGEAAGYLAWPAVAMALVVAFSTSWRILLWLGYRPRPARPADAPDLPRITVLIPAFNEGEMAGLSMRSVLASDYPVDRLQVIAIDDGSRDDTAAYLEGVAASEPDRARVLRLPENRGKRHALAAGFAEVNTPVVVTVDSDTLIPPDALRALVTPLVDDPRAGAVAGRIEALNRADNIITRMLGVRYRLGFDFIRAAQSRLGSVLVCPGAFTAYRMSAIRDHIPAWRDQRFLGRRCHNGDDHALTNHILSRGMITVYQSNAVARTTVPGTYRGLSLMYLRWARSNVRESLRYLGFAGRLAMQPSRIPSVVDALAGIVQIPLRLYIILVGWGLLVVHPGLIGRAVGAAMAMAMVHAVLYLRSDRSLDATYTILYALFSLFTLQWIYPVAAVTVRQSRWLTR